MNKPTYVLSKTAITEKEQVTVHNIQVQGVKLVRVHHKDKIALALTMDAANELWMQLSVALSEHHKEQANA